MRDFRHYFSVVIFLDTIPFFTAIFYLFGSLSVDIVNRFAPKLACIVVKRNGFICLARVIDFIKCGFVTLAFRSIFLSVVFHSRLRTLYRFFAFQLTVFVVIIDIYLLRFGTVPILIIDDFTLLKSICFMLCIHRKFLLRNGKISVFDDGFNRVFRQIEIFGLGAFLCRSCEAKGKEKQQGSMLEGYFHFILLPFLSNFSMVPSARLA